MLPPLMRPRALFAAFAALVVATALSACGEEELTEAVEGQPIEIGGLEYNIQITRFLNPDDTEDAEYLAGQPPAEPGTSYLGVFLVIENESDEPVPSATDYVVYDTVGNEFEVADSESPYALQIGAEVPADGVIPIPNTTAATGPNHGALMVFPVLDQVSDNRPLKLEITSAEGSGEVILDI
jgi:hypothetical protein